MTVRAGRGEIRTVDRLEVVAGQCSDRGRKPVNQDFHGLVVPEGRGLTSKGIAVAIADGISSSQVSQVASESAVAGFLADYYSTPDSWTVKQSAQQVIRALNAWLHAQTRQSRFRYDQDRGYVCTLSVLVLKSATAHLFHVGDARIYRFHRGQLELLTADHRVWLSRDKSCLSRALGLAPRLDIDYLSVPVWPGDRFLLVTDGVYEVLTDDELMVAMADMEGEENDPEQVAAGLVRQALARGSEDNLTAQLICVRAIPRGDNAGEVLQVARALSPPPALEAGQCVDGCRLVRLLHASGRSHVYLAEDLMSGRAVAFKVPAMELRQSASALEGFAMEQWVAQRIRSPHVISPWAPERPRQWLYLVTEYVEGRSLRQWLLDNPRPGLETVCALLEQIARGLRAFHRLEMVHQDLRPDNLLIDARGTVILIDFGATRIAGLEEAGGPVPGAGPVPRGAALYSAPELFLGEPGTPASDQFSLGVIAYQMLTGQLPYGTEVPGVRSRRQLTGLRYRAARRVREDVPEWVDLALARAVHPEAHRRYPALSEFLFDLANRGSLSHSETVTPLLERHPVVFWQAVSALLALGLLIVLALRL